MEYLKKMASKVELFRRDLQNRDAALTRSESVLPGVDSKRREWDILEQEVSASCPVYLDVRNINRILAGR
jgi:hypothetical protein